MDAKPAPMTFIPTFTLFIGGAVLLGGVFTMIGDSKSIFPGLMLAAVGFVLKACGLLTLTFPGARKHIMHVAIMASMFGMGNTFFMWPESSKVWTQAEMVTAGSFILCTVLFAVYLRSFVNARRDRESDTDKPRN